MEKIQEKNPLQRLKPENDVVVMGTGITYPFLFGNGWKKCVSTLLARAKEKIKGGYKTRLIGPTAQESHTLVPCVEEAIHCGIFAFDCARAYSGSEQRLGKAIRNVPRDKLFLITKIEDSAQFLGRVEQCFEESLRQLHTDYVDLLLLHWPVDYPKLEGRFENSVPIYARSWHVLEELYQSGKAKAIGVSNFSIAQLEALKKYAQIMPMANEIECHPLCTRKELNTYCAENGILVLAYSSLCGMDKRLLCGTMNDIAKKHNKSIPQVILKWHLQEGRIPIIGTTKKQRLKEYAALSDVTLTKAELAAIGALNINYRAFPDSEHCDFTKGIWVGWESYKDYCP